MWWTWLFTYFSRQFLHIWSSILLHEATYLQYFIWTEQIFTKKVSILVKWPAIITCSSIVSNTDNPNTAPSLCCWAGPSCCHPISSCEESVWITGWKVSAAEKAVHWTHGGTEMLLLCYLCTPTTEALINANCKMDQLYTPWCVTWTTVLVTSESKQKPFSSSNKKRYTRFCTFHFVLVK